MPSIEQIEAQLQQRIVAYPPVAWGRKQNDNWDQQTNFIYHVYRWNDLQRRIRAFTPSLRQYAINRWFSFWSAKAVERIFCELPGVTANLNQYDRLVDFTILGIKFDHKTSVFPQGYGHSLEFARKNRMHLVKWLYQHQSRQQRYHTANRLYVMLYANDGAHWKLRADISGLRQVVREYGASFDPSRLESLSIGGGQVLSDIVWFVKE
ncbi:MAG: hypothetical protein JXM69_15050 [Anaerolineae bacterium]|nr:hypothetical protein [Anaerolineae bacterium]